MHDDGADDDLEQWRPEDPDADAPPPVPVPHEALAPDTLQAVIEAFVLREGTDYGERETALDAKVAQVQRQLERGDAHVVFDPGTGTVSIVLTRTLGRSPG